MTIKGIREISGLSQRKFADKYHIPYRTVENWEAPIDSDRYRECPAYVTYLLELVVRQDFGHHKEGENEMIADGYNKEDYEITLDDFKAMVDKKLQSLVGTDVMKNGGISKLVKEAVEPALFGTIECDNTLFKIFCPSLGEDAMEEFGRIDFSYKEDKRKRYGVGSSIKDIEFVYTVDTTKVDKYVCNLSQVLSYDRAKSIVEDYTAKITELEAKIKEYKTIIEKAEDVMRVEKYF